MVAFPQPAARFQAGVAPGCERGALVMRGSVFVGRVGGLALALGIGAGVSLACGGVAAAAPGEGAGAAASADAPAGRSSEQRSRSGRGGHAGIAERDGQPARPGTDGRGGSLRGPTTEDAAPRQPGLRTQSASVTPAVLAESTDPDPDAPVQSALPFALLATARPRDEQQPLGAATVTALNPRVTATYSVGVEPQFVVADPRGRWVYTVNEKGERGTDGEPYPSISVLDTATKTVSTYKTDPSGCGCDGRFTNDVAITPDGTLYLFGLEPERALVDVGKYVVGSTARDSGFQWRAVPAETSSSLGASYGGYNIASVAGAVSFDAKTVLTGLIATKAEPRQLSYQEVEARGLNPAWDPFAGSGAKYSEYDTQAVLGLIDTASVAALPVAIPTGGVDSGEESADGGGLPQPVQGNIPKTLIAGAMGQRVTPVQDWINNPRGLQDTGMWINDVELVGSQLAWVAGTTDSRKLRRDLSATGFRGVASVPFVASVITSTGATAYVKLPSDFTGTGSSFEELSLAKTPDGNRVFVGGSKIAVIDGGSRTLLTTIDLLPASPFTPGSNGASVTEMAVSPDGRYLFALNTDSDPARKLFFVIDVATNSVLNTLTLDAFDGGGYASDLAVSPDGRRVYVTTSNTSSLDVVSNLLSEIDLYAPALPTVSISPATLTVAEGNGGSAAANFTVSLSRAATGPVTVQYATANGTATEGSDYTAGSGTLIFAAGTIAQPVSVAVLGDTGVEPDETFTISLVSPSGATLGAATATAVISNDDTAPTAPVVSIGDITVIEGNTGLTVAKFDVSLSRPASAPVTVRYGTSDGTAAAGSDYYPALGTLTFPAGVVSQTVAVDVSGDTDVETAENFTVRLSNPSGADLGTATAVGTIANDDTAPVVPKGPIETVLGQIVEVVTQVINQLVTVVNQIVSAILNFFVPAAPVRTDVTM